MMTDFIVFVVNLLVMSTKCKKKKNGCVCLGRFITSMLFVGISDTQLYVGLQVWVLIIQAF